MPELPCPPAAMLDALPDAVYFVDRDRTVTYWNPAAEKLTGYLDSEVVGRWCGDGLLGHVDQDGRSLCDAGCPLLATMADGTTHRVRVLLHHRDGHLIPVEVSAAALRDESGAVVGAVESFREDALLAADGLGVRQLEVSGGIDPLTGVGNRRSLEVHLLDRLAALRHRGVPLGVLVLDVDDFAALNDRLGRAAGDRLLKVVAETVQHCVPGRGRVFRLGGDEFVVLVAQEGLALLARRICAYVEESRVQVPGYEVDVTVSVGGTAARRGEDFTDVLRRAEGLLAQARRAGGNRGLTDAPGQPERSSSNDPDGHPRSA